MYKFRNALMKFMYGRYGLDQFGIFLAIAYVVVSIISSFFGSGVAALVLRLLALVLILYAIYRMLSKRLDKRRSENEKFIKVYKPAKREVKLFIDRIRYFKTTRFRKCPNCHIIMRLPNKRGKHTTTCPVCHSKVNVRIII